MKNVKILKKLGFDLYSIEDNDLREECEHIINNLLAKYYIDDTINDYQLYKDNNGEKQIDYSNTLQFCRGFNKYNDSYDFIVLKNKKNGVINFIIRPTMQNKFNSEQFGESIRLVYRTRDGLLEMCKLSKYNGDLLNEKYMYTRDSETNELVLLSEYKMYYSDDVKYEEARCKSTTELRKIYDNGNYGINNLIPVFSEIYVTAKTNRIAKKLYVNNLDTGLDLTNGTTVYEIKDGVLKYISNYKNQKLEENSLMDRFHDNLKRYDEDNSKSCIIKKLR